MTGPAKILEATDLQLLLSHVATRRQAQRDTVILLLSFKAGLRACEIAGLDWYMVTGASGGIADSIAVAGTIAKNGRARRIPLHPDLKAALRKSWLMAGRPRHAPVLLSQKGGHLTAGSVVNWFTALYAQVGLTGCSSHSGRRTFITNSARLVAQVGGCLRDVQELAGHSALTTTERYIEGDREAQRKLVQLL
ncbi:site-specific integrase [Alteriqipengyuania flavescens]|uniref:tyrosine-type recombinase/integrase n=1 Tax=Alteriqipengyuania flavescens TaxID=3053610 RepID=UPI0025B523D7|nr:site-specific integrase [Alteriqipengyuania flavescens]WJY18325.1 site-specific integrase [Alteriqipengyuania flavescens]WJY24266.1 site-specific integrase [Alteriqipengyuania flavescens]